MKISKMNVTQVKLAVDIGGTFTDVVLDLPGRRLTRKVLTTISRPELAVLDGARLVLEEAGLDFPDIAVFVHGTTLATNAVLERRGARTALLATEGFRDVIEIGTESRYDQYDLGIQKRLPLVPRELRFTVPERVLASGEVRLPLDEDAVRALAAQLKANEVESAAICYMHGYANPDHERRTRALLSQLLPDLPISLSSEVCPEIREYERTSTTVINAYVQPVMAGYLERMRDVFTAKGFAGAIYLVASNGGLTSLETARRFPVRLIESGPAGGAIFGAAIAASMGERHVLAFDMGGTTAKVCLIENFKPTGERIYEVDRAARFLKGSGLPLRIPVIDLVEIGAGGGSIAHVNALRSVAVGPESAGSDPGPACYGRGGRQPTVTDADAVLGMIDPGDFADGSMKLDLEAARQALGAHVGQHLGMTPEMAAYAVHEIVCENMASAARAHAVERGRNVAEHTLVCSGGAAPLHVSRVAEKLGITRVVIPVNAGVGSAIGFLNAPVSYEMVRSLRVVLDGMDSAPINEMLESMTREARALVAAGAAGKTLLQERRASMRYVGQGHEIEVDLPARPLESGDRQLLRSTFERNYSALFNRSIPWAAIEIISWTVLVTTRVPEIARLPAAQPPKAPQPPDDQREYFDGRANTTQSIPVFRRDRINPGCRVSGPAVITERETTTFVSASFDAHVDAGGNIVMLCKER